MFNQFCIVARAGVTNANILHKTRSMQEDEEKNLSDLSKRFLLVISEQYLNLSGYKLRNAGIISSQSTLTSIKKGIQQPSRKTIDLLCEKYGVDKAWLYTGVRQDTSEVSPVFSESEESEPFAVNHNGVKFYEASNGYRMVVKRVPFCAYGRFINECNTLEPDKMEWGEESFEVPQVVHGKYLAFEVRGESMDDGTRDSFEEGDTVLVRELDRLHWIDGVRFKDYPYWIVVLDSSILIKQIVSQDLKQGTITFHSLNPSPEYSDFTLYMDDIRALYYVLQKKPKIVKF